jgi:hypothetical protein
MNNIFTSFIPTWVSILFLIVIPIPVFLIAFLAKKGAEKIQKNRVFYSILCFYGVYFLYVSLASINGLFEKAALPPTILKLSTLPLFLFLFGVIFNLTIYKTILESLSLQTLIKVHIFRLIGVFFILLAYFESLPKFFAMVAGIGDMVTAITSIFVAKAISKNKNYAVKLAYLWNTFGFIDILFTSVSAFVLTKISMDTGALGVEMLAKFPFCLIPAFAPPTIVFLHMAIYKKLKKVYP